MAQSVLHLCICLQILGFSTSLPVSQTPESISAQPRSQATILCALQVEQAGLYWYRWSQQRQHFQFLLFASPLGTATYGANVSQHKFSVRGTSSYSLHIRDLHPSDTGTYYCSISQSSQLLLGSGTRLSVVDALPVPPKTTPAPPSRKKPTQCVTKSKATDRKGACSPLVWVPLAAGVVILLLSLAPAAHRLHRLRRRLWLRVHRQ
ncbi:T-cell surface glycoprotein CD8 beta chain [Melanerpes formicivorus]|uniref:T-cell surface glycoprotein CD8 beta chain n=1 Tax=Melanerpes formicivorus TaxID=211600 RepID=UPI00358F7EE7